MTKELLLHIFHAENKLPVKGQMIILKQANKNALTVVNMALYAFVLGAKTIHKRLCWLSHNEAGNKLAKAGM